MVLIAAKGFTRLRGSVCGKTNPAACAVPDPSVQAELRSLGGRVGFVLGLRRLRRCRQWEFLGGITGINLSVLTSADLTHGFIGWRII